MKQSIKFLTAFWVMALSWNLSAQNQQTKMDTLSYSVGILIGSNLEQQGLDKVNVSDVAIGLSDAIKGEDLRISLEEANSILSAYIEGQQAKKMGAVIEEGAAFLAENGKKDGVTTLESGLQYQVITAGDGPKPTLKDKVTTHYHGTLIDGTVFDSSYDRGQPASFPVSGVIAGWTEALQLMSVGSKWRLFVPHNLAYGERGAGGAIKPYSTLIFDVELISID